MHLLLVIPRRITERQISRRADLCPPAFFVRDDKKYLYIDKYY